MNFYPLNYYWLKVGRFENFVSYGLKFFTYKGGTDSRSKWTLPASNLTRTIVGATQEYRNIHWEAAFPIHLKSK